jgi:hypothetical protein
MPALLNAEGAKGVDLAMGMLRSCQDLMAKHAGPAPSRQEGGRQSRGGPSREDDARETEAERLEADAFVWAPVAANAAMLAASIVAATPAKQHSLINAGDVCASLIALLEGHPSPPVRSRAAQALGRLAA